jgi:pimeloyl-ACP methyl ester carboxylesterase
MSNPDFRFIETNGVTLRVVVAGEGPLIVLVHGFPESWYSWRHQIGPLTAAGYRVAVPDVRGYGGSDKPYAVAAYAMREHIADLIGLIAALGDERAILVGHDWGAAMVWQTAALHPEPIAAVIGMSVPYLGRGKTHRMAVFDRVYSDRFFYQRYFEEPGRAEAEIGANLRTALRRIYFALSGDAPLRKWLEPKPRDAALLDGLEDPEPFPAWLGAADLDYFLGEFASGGLRGPLNRYRNSERDHESLPELATRKIVQPALFIAGERDPVLDFVPGLDPLPRMERWMDHLRGKILIPGAGHWVQQERPGEVNAALLDFLGRLAPRESRGKPIDGPSGRQKDARKTAFG